MDRQILTFACLFHAISILLAFAARLGILGLSILSNGRGSKDAPTAT